jgi:hypothetical protein
METICAAQQARKRACGLLMLAALLVSCMAQDSSSDTVRVKVIFEGEHLIHILLIALRLLESCGER